MYIWANGSARVEFLAHNNSLHNLLRAIDERIFHVKGPGGELVPTPQPVPGKWGGLGGYASKITRRIPIRRRLTCSEFIAQCPSSKRKLYTRATGTYMARGCGVKDAKLGAFVKFEKLDFTSKPDPVPRVIQPRSPVYNVALGCHTRAVEEDVMHGLSTLFETDTPVVMKGYTVEEVGSFMKLKLSQRSNTVAILLDASRFDQHVSEDALKFEHSVWKSALSGDKRELDWLLRQQLNNRCVTYLDGYKVQYTTRGTRASGDMNTGGGNCILMCTMMASFLDHLKIWGDLANNGDDCVLFIERKNLDRVMAAYYKYFLDLGFEMELETTSECPTGIATVPEHIRFCQMSPVQTVDGWVMVREPIKGTSKDVLALGVKDESTYRQWIYAVGMGGRALYGDMPIYNTLYPRLISEGIDSNINNSLLMRDNWIHRVGKVPRIRGKTATTSDTTRVSFATAFGISPSRQLAIESDLATEPFGTETNCHGRRWNPSRTFGCVVRG